MPESQKDLREKFTKYFLNPTINENREILGMFSNFLFVAVRDHHYEEVNNSATAQAKIILQMLLTKAINLRNLTNGISFTTHDGSSLEGVIDPTIIAVLIRNIYETTGMFNLIYRKPQSDDEKIIIYLLWVLSGLSYRQRFETNIISEEIRKKFEFEKEEIKRLTGLIEQNMLSLSLDLENQDKIRNRIKKKEYLIKFENNKVVFLSWKELISCMGIKPGLFDNMYAYFSLYAHPSNVSVFQFGELFNNDDQPLEMTNFNLQYAIFLLSIFLADYINCFPSVKQSFEQLPVFQQIALNYPNKFTRGEEYSINDSWKALG